MKKLVFCIGTTVLIAIAAINVNLVLNNDKSFADIYLADIVAMAIGEYTLGSGYCRTASLGLILFCASGDEEQCIEASLSVGYYYEHYCADK